MPLSRCSPPTLKPHLRWAYLFLLALFITATTTLAQQNDPRVKSDLRTVSGIVSDPDHEPIRNAVVELENSANHEVISFITTEDGHFTFHRLDSHIDFRLWATFRGHKSTIHTISMYDDHLDKIINITLRPY